MKTTTRHEYFVPAPACWTDVQTAMHMASQDRSLVGLSNSYDDVIKVDSDDNNVVVYWEEEA
jgi:hypothetical protein